MMSFQMTRDDAYGLKADAMERHCDASDLLAKWTARLERANQRVAAGIDQDDNAEQDACYTAIEGLRADIAEAERDIADCNDVLIAGASVRREA
jgi:hypothetical protein